ncbi:hypothetical protein HELRODRAFT_191305 [Helobdella robusta]|uniref:SEC7 domain-containing protein n=1 Tax=Helobdella robusta TaxID=6412 RepID=T1FSV2_HELRO|nr:hypothetical protein HELRODRAFT_191305 [Helobdella robusta]ESO05486.1 hypothetical protein HELRODRAFT_191305 [Helobdella robusta]
MAKLQYSKENMSGMQVLHPSSSKSSTTPAVNNNQFHILHSSLSHSNISNEISLQSGSVNNQINIDHMNYKSSNYDDYYNLGEENYDYDGKGINLNKVASLSITDLVYCSPQLARQQHSPSQNFPRRDVDDSECFFQSGFLITKAFNNNNNDNYLSHQNELLKSPQVGKSFLSFPSQQLFSQSGHQSFTNQSNHGCTNKHLKVTDSSNKYYYSNINSTAGNMNKGCNILQHVNNNNIPDITFSAENTCYAANNSLFPSRHPGQVSQQNQQLDQYQRHDHKYQHQQHQRFYQQHLQQQQQQQREQPQHQQQHQSQQQQHQSQQQQHNQQHYFQQQNRIPQQQYSPIFKPQQNLMKQNFSSPGLINVHNKHHSPLSKNFQNKEVSRSHGNLFNIDGHVANNTNNLQASNNLQTHNSKRIDNNNSNNGFNNFQKVIINQPQQQNVLAFENVRNNDSIHLNYNNNRYNINNNNSKYLNHISSLNTTPYDNVSNNSRIRSRRYLEHDYDEIMSDTEYSGVTRISIKGDNNLPDDSAVNSIIDYNNKNSSSNKQVAWTTVYISEHSSNNNNNISDTSKHCSNKLSSKSHSSTNLHQQNLNNTFYDNSSISGVNKNSNIHGKGNNINSKNNNINSNRIHKNEIADLNVNYTKHIITTPKTSHNNASNNNSNNNMNIKKLEFVKSTPLTSSSASFGNVASISLPSTPIANNLRPKHGHLLLQDIKNFDRNDDCEEDYDNLGDDLKYGVKNDEVKKFFGSGETNNNGNNNNDSNNNNCNLYSGNNNIINTTTNHKNNDNINNTSTKHNNNINNITTNNKNDNNNINNVVVEIVEDGDYDNAKDDKTADGKDEIEMMAEKMFNLDGISKEEVALKINKPTQLSKRLARAYLQHFDFSSKNIDQSLRSFLAKIALIGETQERDRILNEFSRRYYECNDKEFKSEDSCHTMTAAMILLNTDLYGQNIGRKMSEQAFIKNLAGLNDGTNFSTPFLKSIYSSISKDRLPFECSQSVAEPSSSAKALQTKSQKKMIKCSDNPFFETHINLANTNQQHEAITLKKGLIMRKSCLEADGRKTPLGKRNWKMFYATLKDSTLYLCKESTSQLQQSATSIHHKNDHTSAIVGHGSSSSNADETDDINSEIMLLHHSLASLTKDEGIKRRHRHVFELRMANWSLYLIRTNDDVECQQWIDAINLSSSCFSAPPLPGAVGSMVKFQRPLLPASLTKLSLHEQLNQHISSLKKFEQDLVEHETYPPDKGAKNRDVRDYYERGSYLKFEQSRYSVYVQVLKNNYEKLKGHKRFRNQMKESNNAAGAATLVLNAKDRSKGKDESSKNLMSLSSIRSTPAIIFETRV